MLGPQLIGEISVIRHEGPAVPVTVPVNPLVNPSNISDPIPPGNNTGRGNMTTYIFIAAAIIAAAYFIKN